jgi:hypothetical protein
VRRRVGGWKGKGEKEKRRKGEKEKRRKGEKEKE